MSPGRERRSLAHAAGGAGGGGSARLGLEGHLALSEEGGMWRQMQASLPTTYLRALPPWGPWKPEAGPLDSQE